MSYLKKKWCLYPQNQKLLEESSDFKVSPSIAQVIINRGLLDLGVIKKLLSPKLSYLTDPFEIPGLLEAAKRLLLAKQQGEKVLVYGDYDVDGVTATVLLLEALKHLGVKASYYIPHRYKEGYGLNSQALQQIKKDGVSLVVTVDCGISNKKEVALAQQLGMEIIVTDHHNLPEVLPAAFCIVNPKQITSEHPTKYLSGVGVAFKLAWGLFKLASSKDREALVNLLDLVALGTLADVVPLTGENRILVVHGMNILNQRKRMGLSHLTEVAKVASKIGSYQINFALSPRINAAGRLEHARSAVELLLSKDPLEAQQFALELNRINSRRQGIGNNIRAEVLSLIEPEKLKEDKIIFLSGRQWHPGVIGIVASRIVDEFNRPVVLVGLDDGRGRGSARSIPGYSVFRLLKSCEDLFTDFGGHEGAAGFSIETSKVAELEKRLKQVAEKTLSLEMLVPSLWIDAELAFAEINIELLKQLAVLEPYGEGNAEPVFMTRRVVLESLRPVGTKGEHLKLCFSSQDQELEVIAFGFARFGPDLVLDKTYDIAYNLGLNEYNGSRSVELSLVDMAKSEDEQIR